MAKRTKKRRPIRNKRASERARAKENRAALHTNIKSWEAGIPTPTYYPEPTFDPKTGLFHYKYGTYNREEFSIMNRIFTRTPVSGGRFPTESDLILNTFRERSLMNAPRTLGLVGGEPVGNVTDFSGLENDPAAKRWKENLSQAFEHMRDFQPSAEKAGVWQEAIDKLSDMSTAEFLTMMDSDGGEMSVSFTYDIASTVGYGERVIEILDKWA